METVGIVAYTLIAAVGCASFIMALAGLFRRRKIRRKMRELDELIAADPSIEVYLKMQRLQNQFEKDMDKLVFSIEEAMRRGEIDADADFVSERAEIFVLTEEYRKRTNELVRQYEEEELPQYERRLERAKRELNVLLMGQYGVGLVE